MSATTAATGVLLEAVLVGNGPLVTLGPDTRSAMVSEAAFMLALVRRPGGRHLVGTRSECRTFSELASASDTSAAREWCLEVIRRGTRSNTPARQSAISRFTIGTPGRHLTLNLPVSFSVVFLLSVLAYAGAAIMAAVDMTESVWSYLYAIIAPVLAVVALVTGLYGLQRYSEGWRPTLNPFRLFEAYNALLGAALRGIWVAALQRTSRVVRRG